MTYTNFKIYKHAPMSKKAGHNIYSLRDKIKVIDHLDYICLSNCEFYVNQRGRQRVLAETVKNVHAYIKAESYDTAGILPTLAFRVVYDPFKYDHFMVMDLDGNLQPIHKSDKVFCTKVGVYVEKVYN
jgi:hypothetical protein